MKKEFLLLGIDLGTSGVRLAIINHKYELIHFSSNQYYDGLDNCEDWKNCCKVLIQEIPNEIKQRIIACSIDGTSGTLMGCDYNGNPLGKALPYYLYCKDEESQVNRILGGAKNKSQNNISLGKACRLINIYGDKILLRHQADWVSGWFLNDWEY